MTIQTLEQAATKDLTTAFNHAFSDYLIPVQLNEAQMTSKIISDGIQLPLSVGMYDDEKLIGFILYGMDVIEGKQVAYNAGTGVIPDKRGQKIASQLLDVSLNLLRSKKVARVQLEVITTNTRAFNLYAQMGFNIKRELNCYKGRIPSVDQSQHDIRIIPTVDWELIKTWWNTEPSWQNSISGMKRIEEQIMMVGAFENNQLSGYLILNPTSKRIHQFGVDKNFRHRGIGRALFQFISSVADTDFSLINMDDADQQTNDFLRRLGLVGTIQQFEMSLEWTNKS